MKVCKRHLLISFLAFGLLLTMSRLTTAQQKISLAGTWELRLDPQDKGIRENWWKKVFPETVKLPGSLTENGKGNEVTIDTPWSGEIVDSSYFFANKYAKYRQGDVKIPFWLKPDKYFAATAWYRKTIEIPEDWAKKRVVLNLERCHWETTIYVNNQYCGSQNSLVAPHQYDITPYITAHKNVIVVRVENRPKINFGANSSSITDHTQTNWNGIIGDISLQKFEKIFIENLQIISHLSTASTEIVLNLKQPKRESFKGKIVYQVQNLQGGKALPVQEENINLSAQTTTFNLKYAIPNPELWSEFTPNLYQLNTKILDEKGNIVDEKNTNFGMREVATEGTRITLNGKPIFLRGDVDCAGFPLTGYPSMEAEFWMKVFKTIKNYGLNHLRFHSWCPPEVAFQEADRLGVYLYVECPVWANHEAGVGTGGMIDDFIYAESERIIRQYGNHPSFIMMSTGNEPGGKNQNIFLGNWVDFFKAKDNRRLYTSSAGWPIVPENQFNIHSDARIQRWGEGNKSIINKEKPNTNYDWLKRIKGTQPYVSHEIGQWCAYPNFKEISKYKGILKATNFEIFKETLAQNGMADQAEDFLYASGRLQTLCYKADIEAALRTPGFAGFQLLGLHDFPGQGTALVGALDAFWESKGYTTPEEYRTFCNKTVLLARFPSLILQNSDTLNANIEIAHFGENEIKNAKIIWKISDEQGKIIKTGFFNKAQINLGNAQTIGTVNYILLAIKQAQKLIFQVQLEGSEIKNSWEFWVYPSNLEEDKNLDNILIVNALNDDILRQIEAGKSVLLLPFGHVKNGKGAEVKIGFSSIFWNTAYTNNQAPHTLGLVCNPKHPMFKYFPTEGYSNYQWQDIVSHAQTMNVTDFPSNFKPLIQPIDTWFENRKLSLAFEGKIGKGKLMVCSIDLETNINQRPSSRQLKYSLLKYMKSKEFNPIQVIDAVQLKNFFQENTSLNP
jgi:Glycosyl hydrolases family 2, sugar binding domain/Glycosyl hydrolases family 2/Glycosyl hydrolases family 2, TIM barrel domain